MMNSEVKIYSRPDGAIQRVQVVRLENWQDLDFMPMQYDDQALACFANVYRRYLVPGCPWIFGKLVMFHIPDDYELQLPKHTDKYGWIGDKHTQAAAAIEKNVKFVKGKPVFKDQETEKFWHDLEERGCLHVISGKLPFTQAIPVGECPGYMSRNEIQAALKVNTSFFIMDPIDCATVFDHVGTPIGLCVKNGAILNPPMFDREALLVNKEGQVTIGCPCIQDLNIHIGNHIFKAGKNAVLYTRPEGAKTPSDKRKKIVIVGQRVVAVKESGSVKIPASGFVLCPHENCSVAPGDTVSYDGLEDVLFGIQVGNSIMRDGKKTESFRSGFYNIKKLERVPYPPSLYPMDFDHARAARMAIGADRDGKPVIFWAEGASKIKYVPGVDSTGASLKEMAEIAEDLGLVQCVNLDGGGSAQILLNNQRSLKISDRAPDNSETERPVPMGLMVR
ncbi:MAG: phosphodiester glycosidase family protein [Firmicutes bacterium]|nr:phosphodiester glycosidase family protein [Bacillota bacterium]